MNVAHFYCFGVIGESDPMLTALVGNDPFISSKAVSDFVNRNQDAEELVIHINSRGGNADEGFAIHDLLVNSGKKITTRVEGQAYSIASVILLAGSVRQATENSKVGIHNPYLANGDALTGLQGDQIIHVGKEVKQTETRVLDFYTDKTGKDRETIKQMMDADTAMDAKQAHQFNFITEILTPVKAFAFIAPVHAQKNSESTFMENLDKKFNAFIKNVTNALRTGNGLTAQNGLTVVNLDVTTKDGQTLTVSDDDADGLPSNGDKVTNADGTPYASQTNAELADGTMITTDENGVITEVTAPASNEGDAAAAASANAAVVPDAKDEQIAALTEKVNAQAAELESYKNLEARMETRMGEVMKLIKSDAQLDSGAQNFSRQPGAGAQLTAEDTYKKIKERNAKK